MFSAPDVERNWASGRSKARMLMGHQDYIRAVQLAGNTLVSCSGSIGHHDCAIRCVPSAHPSVLCKLLLIVVVVE
jgi:hypothetical protein